MLSVETVTNPLRARAAEQRRRFAEQAHACARWLKIQGFEILRIERDFPQPRIHIRASALCEQLEGAVSCFERSPRFERRYKRVTRLDCEIRWAEGLPK